MLLRIKNMYRLFVDKLVAFSNKVNWLVFALVSLFTVSSWLDVQGVVSQYPLMIPELPEGWKIPGILNVIVQIGQIGPLVFVILRRFFPNRVTYRRAIFIVLTIGFVACTLLAFFWDRTAYVGHEPRSIALYALTFAFSLLDQTANVTFLQWIGEFFVTEYIVANYVGESVSNLIPSILGFIQGIGTEQGCVNQTSLVPAEYNSSILIAVTELVAERTSPRFSVQVFFFIISACIVTSFLAFVFLNFSSYAKRFYKDAANFGADTINWNEKSLEQAGLTSKERFEKYSLIVVVFVVNFFYYGVLPGLQSYAVLPYGDRPFFLAINLSLFITPLAVIVSIWSYQVSLVRVVIEFTVTIIVAIYTIVCAAMSPCPPMVGTHHGAGLQVFAWVFTGFMFMRLRTVLATRLNTYGKNSLHTVGIVTCLGQLFGGILIYLIIEQFHLLKDKPPCVNDFSYCH